MQIFNADATIFSSEIQKISHIKCWKNHLKNTQFYSPWAAQMTQTEEFMFQKVAFRTTVYKTGA